MHNPYSLTLKEVTQRLKMLGVDRCSPYKDRQSYFVGTDKSKAVLPMISGPVCFISNKLGEDDVLPGPQVANILKRCGLSEDDQAQFWGAISHTSNLSAKSLPPNQN